MMKRATVTGYLDINKEIVERNRYEREHMKNLIRCQDIRVISGKLRSTNLTIKTQREDEPKTVMESDSQSATSSAATSSIEASICRKLSKIGRMRYKIILKFALYYLLYVICPFRN